jgi:hypothetical protein
MRRQSGSYINVEIHRDALSADQPGTLRLGSLAQPPRSVAVAGRRLFTFDHVDMLVHLCAHALEPGARTRLIAVADLVGYAARYSPEIDWAFIQRRHPRVVNALTMMHYVTPLPKALRTIRPASGTRPPRGTGRGMIPLGSVVASGRGVRDLYGRLLYPPDWWMRAFYGVSSRSLGATRWGRHLWRVAYWMGRRVFVSAGRWGSANPTGRSVPCR